MRVICQLIATFVFLFLLSVNAFSYDQLITNINDLQSIEKVDMVDVKQKQKLIINKLKINLKYKFNENKIFISKIIIGQWFSPPHTSITFYKNNYFDRVNHDTKQIEKGFWKITDDGLIISYDNKNWVLKKIDYFILMFNKDDNNYFFSLKVKNDPMFGLIIDDFK